MTKTEKKSTAVDRRIVVLQNGWVFVGAYTPATETKPAHLHDASNIRKWGTTSGLGQIALNGPTAETVLDPCGIVVLDNAQAVIFTHPCNW